MTVNNTSGTPVGAAKRLLPLAGIIQSAHLVAGAARSGMIAQDALTRTLNCIFVQNPESISDVYHGTGDIEVGMGLLSSMLTQFDLKNHGEIVKYTLALMSLERTFAKRPDISAQVSAGIQNVQTLRMAEDSDWVEALAALYEESIGQLQPRIQVTGHQQHLQNPINIQRIRALLLAGLRSAVLWRQLGGRRWHLLVSKQQMKIALDSLK